jgi:hypothetical protein
MTANSVVVWQNAGRHDLTVTVDGKVTTVDLSSLDRERRVELAGAFFTWALKGFKGYPDLGDNSN